MQVPSLRQQLQGLGERRIVGRSHQPSPAQVDQPGIFAFIRPFPIAGIIPPNECSPSHFSSYDPTLLGDGVSPAHGSDGNAQAIGQLPLGGKTGSWRQPPALHVAVQGLNQGEVFRLSGRIEFWSPTCHSDNLLFDTNCVNIDIVSDHL